MKTVTGLTSLLSAALLLVSAWNSAYATPVGPVAATERIDVTIAQNQPLELFFPNVFDLDHPKLLELHGVLAGPEAGTLAIFFDWFDPAGNHFFSPVQEFSFTPGGVNQVDMNFTIPFCPPQVSVDFRLADARVVRFVGDFTHTCCVAPVPDGGGTFALLASALGTLGFVQWRRRSC